MKCINPSPPNITSSELRVVIQEAVANHRRGYRAVHLQPVTQAISAGIVPGDAGSMHAGTRGLPDNQQSRTGARAHHGIGTQGKRIGAMAAGADLGKEVLQRDQIALR